MVTLSPCALVADSFGSSTVNKKSTKLKHYSNYTLIKAQKRMSVFQLVHELDF